MSNISVSLPSDGDTIDVADYNTPITTIVNEFNGNIDNSNLSASAAIAGSKLADGAITNAKLSTSGGEPGAAWTSATPTWTNLTVGNAATNILYWARVGKTVVLRLRFVYGSTSSITGALSFTLPAAPNTTNISSQNTTLGSAILGRGAGAKYSGAALYLFASPNHQCLIRADSVAGSYIAEAELSTTIPFTWTTNDEINVLLTYEAA